MTETDLLVGCPECHSWPMAVAAPLARRYGEMMFRCLHCGHREVFNLKFTDGQEGAIHRPYDLKNDSWGGKRRCGRPVDARRATRSEGSWHR